MLERDQELQKKELENDPDVYDPVKELSEDQKAEDVVITDQISGSHSETKDKILPDQESTAPESGNLNPEVYGSLNNELTDQINTDQEYVDQVPTDQTLVDQESANSRQISSDQDQETANGDLTTGQGSLIDVN